MAMKDIRAACRRVRTIIDTVSESIRVGVTIDRLVPVVP